MQTSFEQQIRIIKKEDDLHNVQVRLNTFKLKKNYEDEYLKLPRK